MGREMARGKESPVECRGPQFEQHKDPTESYRRPSVGWRPQREELRTELDALEREIESMKKDYFDECIRRGIKPMAPVSMSDWIKGDLDCRFRASTSSSSSSVTIDSEYLSEEDSDDQILEESYDTFEDELGFSSSIPNATHENMSSKILAANLPDCSPTLSHDFVSRYSVEEILLAIICLCVAWGLEHYFPLDGPISIRVVIILGIFAWSIAPKITHAQR